MYPSQYSICYFITSFFKSAALFRRDAADVKIQMIAGGTLADWLSRGITMSTHQAGEKRSPLAVHLDSNW